MEEKEEQSKTESTFGYMEELSKAYREAFAKRLAQRKPVLPEEKRDAIARMQADLSVVADFARRKTNTNEQKELLSMVGESAQEVLRLLCIEQTQFSPSKDVSSFPVSALLMRGVMLGNRSLNLLVRHGEADGQLAFLILSELSALYALAAIN